MTYTSLHILGRLRLKDEVPKSTFIEESQQNLEGKYDARPGSETSVPLPQGLCKGGEELPYFPTTKARVWINSVCIAFNNLLQLKYIIGLYKNRLLTLVNSAFLILCGFWTHKG